MRHFSNDRLYATARPKKSNTCNSFSKVWIFLKFKFSNPPNSITGCAPNSVFGTKAAKMFYAMFERGQKASGASLIRCDQFPAASESINALMPKLIEAAAQNPELKNRWYAVEFLSALSGEMLVTMITTKTGRAWQRAAETLVRELGIHIIGRSRGQKIVLTQDYIIEELNVNGKTFRYRQVEGSFTQPNARVCEKMLGWACDVAQNLGGDLLELYCGNGNFTLPLSQHFRQVLATEVSKTSVYAAQWNIEANQRDNIKIARLSAEEFTEAYTQSREFRRLQEQGISLKDYDFPRFLSIRPEPASMMKR